MKKLFILLALISYISFAQSPVNKYSGTLQKKVEMTSDNDELFVWLFFTDKGENTSLLSSPSSVVSEKSLKRRAKVLDENSLIDIQDLPVSAAYINRVTDLGFTVKQKSKWFNGISGYVRKDNLDQISVLPFIKSADAVAQLKKEYPRSYEYNNYILQKPGDVNVLNYGSSFTQVNQINVPALHNQGYFGQGVTICVMDAGFNRLSHESFATMNIIAQWDFVNNNYGVGDSSDMGSGTHGTMTLSTIGGYKEGQLIGPAFQSTYILAKTENTETETPIEEDNWIAALEWADSIGVDVTSTSLGYITYDFPYPSYTWQSMNGNTARITIAGDLAVARGIVVVNSAGNEGLNTSHNTLGAPADGDSIIAVGAVTSSGARSYFSSVGPTVDGRIKPDIMAMGTSVRVASTSFNNGYTTADGTSFSCPLAAGAAALLLSYNPNLTPIQVRTALRSTASLSSNPNNQMGWGIINALNAALYYPTPVELESFTAQKTASGILLSWITATEKNNMGFDIEKKTDLGKWQKIGFVQGAGTTSDKTKYSYTDNSSSAGVITYRLKQVDYDGTTSYSKEVNIDASVPGEYQLMQNYPNPFNPSTVIKYSLPKESSVTINLYNAIGQKVDQIVNTTSAPGTYEVSFNGSNLSGGVYLYTIEATAADGSGTFKSTRKFVLLK